MKVNDIGTVTTLINKLNIVERTEPNITRSNSDVVVRFSGDVIANDKVEKELRQDLTNVINTYKAHRIAELRRSLNDYGVEV